MLNNRQYSLLAEPTVTASFQSFTHIPGTDNILSESHEDLLQMLKQKSNIQHTKLHSIDGTRPQQNQLSMHLRQQQSMHCMPQVSTFENYHRVPTGPKDTYKKSRLSSGAIMSQQQTLNRHASTGLHFQAPTTLHQKHYSEAQPERQHFVPAQPGRPSLSIAPDISNRFNSVTNNTTENVTPARSHSSTNHQAFHKRSRSYISNDELSQLSALTKSQQPKINIRPTKNP